MGEMLGEQEMNPGGDPPLASREGLPTLADVGITYSMSSRAQKIASVDWSFMRMYENIWRHITIFVPVT